MSPPALKNKRRLADPSLSSSAYPPHVGNNYSGRGVDTQEGKLTRRTGSGMTTDSPGQFASLSLLEQPNSRAHQPSTPLPGMSFARPGTWLEAQAGNHLQQGYHSLQGRQGGQLPSASWPCHHCRLLQGWRAQRCCLRAGGCWLASPRHEKPDGRCKRDRLPAGLWTRLSRGRFLTSFAAYLVYKISFCFSPQVLHAMWVPKDGDVSIRVITKDVVEVEKADEVELNWDFDFPADYMPRQVCWQQLSATFQTVIACVVSPEPDAHQICVCTQPGSIPACSVEINVFCKDLTGIFIVDRTAFKVGGRVPSVMLW